MRFSAAAAATTTPTEGTRIPKSAVWSKTVTRSDGRRILLIGRTLRTQKKTNPQTQNISNEKRRDAQRKQGPAVGRKINQEWWTDLSRVIDDSRRVPLLWLYSTHTSTRISASFSLSFTGFLFLFSKKFRDSFQLCRLDKIFAFYLTEMLLFRIQMVHDQEREKGKRLGCCYSIDRTNWIGKWGASIKPTATQRHGGKREKRIRKE
jgi:hypothetical protein